MAGLLSLSFPHPLALGPDKQNTRGADRRMGDKITPQSLPRGRLRVDSLLLRLAKSNPSAETDTSEPCVTCKNSTQSSSQLASVS
jgi:hypothetical protein